MARVRLKEDHELDPAIQETVKQLESLVQRELRPDEHQPK